MKNKIIKTKEEARQYAIEWQKTFSERNMTYGQIAEQEDIFTKLGRKFGLLREFKENGII